MRDIKKFFFVDIKAFMRILDRSEAT